MSNHIDKLPTPGLIGGLIFSTPKPVETVAQLHQREMILDAWRQACRECDNISIVSIWIAELALDIGEIEISNAIEIVRVKLNLKDTTTTTINEIREALRTFVDPMSV